MSILEGLQDGKQPSFRYEYVNSIHFEIEKSDSISGLLKKITKYEIVNSDSCLSGAKVKACYAEGTQHSAASHSGHMQFQMFQRKIHLWQLFLCF